MTMQLISDDMLTAWKICVAVAKYEGALTCLRMRISDGCSLDPH